MEWHRFEVDGVEYFWATHAGKERVDREPTREIEFLRVARHIGSPGVGTSYAKGTMITEQHAIDLVRLMHRNAVTIS